MKFGEKLKKIKACSKAIEWVEQNDYSFEDAWQNCSKADWMMWLSGFMAGSPGWSTRKEIVFIFCEISEDLLRLVPGDKHKSAEIVEVIKKWTKGEVLSKDIKALVDNTFSEFFEKVMEVDYTDADVEDVALAASVIAADVALSADWYNLLLDGREVFASVTSTFANVVNKYIESKEMCDFIRQNLKTGEML